MAIILNVNGKLPTYGNDCFLAPNATLVGDVTMGDYCSVWFGAVVRGDVNSIRIGNKVNIQDGCVIHCTYQKSTTHIEDSVSIGHNAIIHGCHIHPKVLIGMGAIIMDHVVVESNVIVAAGSIVTEKKILESGWIYAGNPAKKLKPLSESLLHGEIERIAKNYLKYSAWYKQ